MKALRWILMPVACVAAWYVAFFIGLFILSAAESFCPKGQMVSGMCTAPWWRPVEKSIFCFSTGLSTILVVTTGFFVAPAARAFVAWLVFGIGSIVAFWMAAGGFAWAECISAIAAGLLTAFLLARSRYARLPNNSVQPTAACSAVSGG